MACSNVIDSGVEVFGIEALVVPSVTYGPYRPASSFRVVPFSVNSRSTFFGAA